MTRRVAVVLVDRANYGRLKPVMEALSVHPKVELQTVAGGTMVLERFGKPLEVVRARGFEIHAEIYQELEGSTPATMAKSIGFGVTEYANAFHRLEPDMVLIIGDRYEALSAAIAAAYMNICLVHVQGGEVSGSIDESARHAITKLAHYHFPATQRAADYVVRMGERAETVLGVGCPSSDLARTVAPVDPTLLNGAGAGAVIDPRQPYVLAAYHPTTTEFGTEAEQMEEVLEGLAALRTPTVLMWPNIDAGSDRISKRIRIFRQHFSSQPFLRTLTNLEPAAYLSTLAGAACAVGNSSSFVRDAGFFGTPVVLVGRRQAGREFDVHLTPVARVERSAIAAALRRQLDHGRYPASSLYGDGRVSARIADAVASAPLYVQKRLAYVDETRDLDLRDSGSDDLELVVPARCEAVG